MKARAFPKPTKMQEVARAAGVSAATVSNVINHPDLVAAATRQRVETLISDLNFIPGQHAAALRRAAVRVGRTEPTQAPSESPRNLPASVDTDTVPAIASRGTNDSPNEDLLVPGRRVTVAIEHEVVSGIIDVVMHDNSCFWLWADGGMGRRLIDRQLAAFY